MIVIPLQPRWIDYQTDHGLTVRAWRAFVRVEFNDKNGNSTRCSGFIDSGTSFSVIPYSFWHDLQMVWQPLGSHFTKASQGPIPALECFGVPCQLGETQLALFDRNTGLSSQPLRVVAKFPVSRLPPSLETFMLLGCEIIAVNNLTLWLQGVAGQLEGSIHLP